MTREFNEEKLSRLMDGDLSPDEQRLVEVHLEGNKESLKKLHAMLQARDLIRELPRHMCPVNLAAKVGNIREQDGNRKAESIEFVFFRMLAKGAAVAAILAIALFISLNGTQNGREHFTPVNMASNSSLPENDHRAMKVSGGEAAYDIFDSSYKPSIAIDLRGFKLTASQKKSLDTTIVFHMSDSENDRPALLDMEKDLYLTREFESGYGLPVYRYKSLTPADVAKLVESLRQIDTSLEVNEKVSQILSSPSNMQEPVDIYLLIEFPSR